MPYSRKSARLNPNHEGNENSSQNNTLSPKGCNTQENQSKYNRRSNGPNQRNSRSSNLSKQDPSTLTQNDFLSESADKPNESDAGSVKENNLPKSDSGEKQENESVIKAEQELKSQSLSKPMQEDELEDEEMPLQKAVKPTKDGSVKSEKAENSMEEQVDENPDVEMEMNVESVEKNNVTDSSKKVSATTKALNNWEKTLEEKKKLKKTSKNSLSIRRQKLNKRLAKILSPKNPITLLQQLAPGATFKIQPNLSPNRSPQFGAEVDYKGEVIGTGQGSSKSQSKTAAAENAIKAMVSKAMSENSKPKTNEVEGMNVDECVSENLPWAGLASFALFKLFSEWQDQGVDLFLGKPPAASKPKNASEKPETPRELPPNADQLHPSSVLCIMKPGITAVELNRSSGPNAQVTMGYKIDGQMFTGTGSNKKSARKEAAKAAVSALWGVKYS